MQDPGVPFASKGYLVEGGIGRLEASIADPKLQKAAAKGCFPLSFNITNISPAGPGAATANITASGPHLAPTTRTSHSSTRAAGSCPSASAMALIRRCVRRPRTGRMQPTLVAVLSAATIAAVLGCRGVRPMPRTTPVPTARVDADVDRRGLPRRPLPLPPPDALTDVLYRLADPAVPGTQKLNLVEGATAGERRHAGQVHQRAADNGDLPDDVHRHDIAWSDRDPADVVATVNVNTAHANPGSPSRWSSRPSGRLAAVGAEPPTCCWR